MKDDLIDFIEYIDGDIPEYMKDFIAYMSDKNEDEKKASRAVAFTGISGRTASIVVNDRNDLLTIKDFRKEEESLALFRKGVKRGKYL